MRILMIYNRSVQVEDLDGLQQECTGNNKQCDTGHVVPE